MRHTRAHTRNRRSHHFLKKIGILSCSKCGEPTLPHKVCKNCGFYKGKEVIDVLARLTKKEKKNKESELRSQEGKAMEEKALSAEKLSQK